MNVMIKVKILLLLIPLFFGLAINAQCVNVAAASNLRNIMDEIIQSYESTYPGRCVRITYGASGVFCQQILNGANYDLFLSADMDYPQKIKEEKGLSNNVRVYAKGRVVMWCKKPVNLKYDNMSFLSTINKIAIANPKVAPYGKIVFQYLQKKGIYEKVKSKIVFGESITQVAHFLDSGNADLGFPSLSLVVSTNLKNDGAYYELPESEMPLIKQGFIKIKGKHTDDFIDFFMSPECEKIWLKYGYSL